MKLEASDVSTRLPTEVVVRLSRRNLKALLHKLDWEESERTLQRQEEPGGPILTVIAEDDPEHYGDRTPGPMHPETEAAIGCYGSTSNRLRCHWEVD